MNRNCWLAVLGLVVLASAHTVAQQGNVWLEPSRSATVNLVEPYRPAESKVTTEILGTIIDTRDFVVGGARVQLRDLNTGAVVKQAAADADGEYRFELDLPGTYAVEMLGADDVIVAVSNAVTVARYQSVRTVIQVPGRWEPETRRVERVQRLMDFAGMSAAYSMTATTLDIAQALDVTAADAGEPVSAFQSR